MSTTAPSSGSGSRARWHQRRLARSFCPDFHYDKITSVDLDMLWADGIRGLIMDLDNTLVPLHSSDLSDEVIAWAASAREKGFKLSIASNTRRYKRLHELAELLGAQYVKGVQKPRRGGFRRAALQMGLGLHEVAVVGDQVLTDVFAAKRLGVKAILVDRFDDREFIITRFNRRVERAIVDILRRAGHMPNCVFGGPPQGKDE
jgi:uncharacterized protein